MHRTVKPNPHHLRDTMRIVAVGLVDLCLQHRLRARTSPFRVTAAIMIPVRAFVLSMVLFRAPGARTKFLKIWPFLVLLDELWALSPFLLLHHISYGLALSCTALLVYSPFAQRSLMLMGASESAREISTSARGT